MAATEYARPDSRRGRLGAAAEPGAAHRIGAHRQGRPSMQPHLWAWLLAAPLLIAIVDLVKTGPTRRRHD